MAQIESFTAAGILALRVALVALAVPRSPIPCVVYSHSSRPLVLLLVSLGVGVFTADLPFWRRALQLPLPADGAYLPVATIGAPARRATAGDAAPATARARRAGGRGVGAVARATPVRAPC